MITDLVRIPLKEQDIRDDYQWLNLAQTEGYTKTYMINHPEVVARGLGVPARNLKLYGVEVTLPIKGKKKKSGGPQVRRADFVYMDSSEKSHYYLVEAKEYFNSTYGPIQARKNAKLLHKALEREGLKSFTITPVFVGVDWKNKRGYVAGLPPTD